VDSLVNAVAAFAHGKSLVRATVARLSQRKGRKPGSLTGEGARVSLIRRLNQSHLACSRADDAERLAPLRREPRWSKKLRVAIGPCNVVRQRNRAVDADSHLCSANRIHKCRSSSVTNPGTCALLWRRALCELLPPNRHGARHLNEAGRRVGQMLLQW
jgi:hypothetical protein